MAADDKGEVYIYKDILSQDAASTVKKENMTEPLFTRVYLSRDIHQDEVKKKLPEVGNVHITGIVNESSNESHSTLQTTRLCVIMQIADVITSAFGMLQSD